jgi:hypothetical protein
VNDAERLSQNPTFRLIGSEKIWESGAARAAGAEPAGLQSGKSVAATGAAPTNREVLADEFAATAGEDRRTAGKTCTLLLATPAEGRPRRFGPMLGRIALLPVPVGQPMLVKSGIGIGLQGVELG